MTRGRSFTGDQNNLDNPGKSENSKICLETDYPFLSLSNYSLIDQRLKVKPIYDVVSLLMI